MLTFTVNVYVHTELFASACSACSDALRFCAPSAATLHVMLSLSAIFSLASVAPVTVPQLDGRVAVQIEALATGAFRLSASIGGTPSPLDTPMVAATAPAADAAVHTYGSLRGLKASFGTLLASPSGQLRLSGADGAVVFSVPEGFISAPDDKGTVVFRLGCTATSRMLGAGTDGPHAEEMTATAARAYVDNKASMTPYLYSSDGFAALAVSESVDLVRAATLCGRNAPAPAHARHVPLARRPPPARAPHHAAPWPLPRGRQCRRPLQLPPARGAEVQLPLHSGAE